MARPRKGEEKHRPHRVGFRVSEEVRSLLESEAVRTGKSLGDVAHEALEAYFKRRQQRKPKKETP